MGEINFIYIVDFIRTLLYLLVCLEFLFLGYAYWYGYVQIKRSKIIIELARTMFYLGTYFLMLAFFPVIRRNNQDLYEVMILVSTALLLPIAFYLDRFRKQSFLVQVEDDGVMEINFFKEAKKNIIKFSKKVYVKLISQLKQTFQKGV